MTKVLKKFRNLKQKLKTAKGRKIASTRWLERHLNDPYVALAKKQGYRSRAAFKLEEIDDKFEKLVVICSRAATRKCSVQEVLRALVARNGNINATIEHFNDLVKS